MPRERRLRRRQAEARPAPSSSARPRSANSAAATPTARCSARPATSTTSSGPRAARRAARAPASRRISAPSRSARKASPRSAARRSGTASPACARPWASSAAAASTAAGRRSTARSARWRAPSPISPKLLDCMVGYDPERSGDRARRRPRTASYSGALDKAALKGARIGILREADGLSRRARQRRFQAGRPRCSTARVADLAKAGAEIVDPIVIPDLKALLAKRARSVADDDTMFELYFSSGDTPFETRAAGDGLAAVRRRSSTAAIAAGTTTDTPKRAPRLPEGARDADDQPAEGHGRPPARRHRAQGGRAPADADQGRRQSALRRPEGRAAHQHVPDVCAVDRGAGRLHPQTICRPASPSSAGPTTTPG